MKRRSAIGLILVAAAAVLVAAGLALFDAGGAEAQVTVYRSPACGCCAKWIRHLEDAGFAVDVVDVADSDGLARIRAEQGVPSALASCHTTVIDGYVVEGHVPADAIRRLMAERPAIAGLSVPGMPEGSPGMEGPNPVPYAILAIGTDGTFGVYERRPALPSGAPANSR